MKSQRRILAVACALALTGVAQADGVPGQGTWETTLQPRDIDGDTVTDAFYDTALDITWLRNANVNGPMNWVTANTWANTLVVGGVGGWRLPTVTDTGAPGCADLSYAGGTDCGYNVDTATGEMAHLYYVTLGNLAYYDTSGKAPQPGWGLTNTGGFQNLQSNEYWSGTEYAVNPGLVWWYFEMDIGFRFRTYGDGLYDGYEFTPLYAMAVHPGDVAAIPEPETYALMLAGLGMLGLLAGLRRNGAG